MDIPTAPTSVCNRSIEFLTKFPSIVYFFHSCNIYIMCLIPWLVYKFLTPNFWYFSGPYPTSILFFLHMTDLVILEDIICDIIVLHLSCINLIANRGYKKKSYYLSAMSTIRLLSSKIRILLVCTKYLQYLPCMKYFSLLL